MVQHLEELIASILTTDASIVNMQECHLEKPTPSDEYLEIFQGTHPLMKDIRRFNDDYEQLEWLLEEFPHGEDVQESLEEDNVHGLLIELINGTLTYPTSRFLFFIITNIIILYPLQARTRNEDFM